MLVTRPGSGQAWEPTTPSPWCEILSEDVMQLMEYREELKQFWTSGPAYEINGRVACFTLKDIHQSFHQAVHQQSPGFGLYCFGTET